MSIHTSKRAGLGTLVLSNAHAEAEVCPARGALVTRFRSGNDEVLYLDEATFADFGKSVRGGVPILFPVAGPPAAGSPLKQHGFARTSAWDAEQDGERLKLSLSSSDDTLEVWPHPFRLDFTLELVGARLELRWQVFNTGHGPMPLHFGLHPYFNVPLPTKAKARIDTAATRAWNNLTKTLGPVPPLDFGGPELDVHLLDHGSQGTVLHRGDGTSVRLEWSRSLDTVILWTLPGKPFVCVEPWTGPAEATRAALVTERPQLPPGGATSIAFTIGG